MTKKIKKNKNKKRSRHLRLDNSVLAYTVSNIIKEIEEILSDNSVEPIYFHINTYGGSVYDGLALYDYLQSLPVPVVTIGEGKVMSMGTILMLAGDIKVSLPNTTYMVHEVSSMSWGKLSNIENDLRETKRLNDIMKRIYRTHLNLDKEKIDSMLSGEDKFLTPPQAKKIGLVDTVSKTPVLGAWWL